MKSLRQRLMILQVSQIRKSLSSGGILLIDSYRRKSGSQKTLHCWLIPRRCKSTFKAFVQEKLDFTSNQQQYQNKPTDISRLSAVQTTTTLSPIAIQANPNSSLSHTRTKPRIEELSSSSPDFQKKNRIYYNGGWSRPYRLYTVVRMNPNRSKPQQNCQLYCSIRVELHSLKVLLKWID